jgi:hypothetical protein
VEATNYAVADTFNNRVLIYDGPFSTNQSASVVLGQADFTHNAPSAPTINTIYRPTAVAPDSSGNLYVADANTACRVLEFKPPFTNNMNASVVFGEPDFTTGTCGASASALGMITAIASDVSGDLWVADNQNSRIVEFVPPFSNGMSALLVIGQTSLTSTGGCDLGLGTPTASTICFTEGLTFDSSGDLWVADSGNSRVLEFKPPFSNDMAASLELGQPSGATAFTSNTSNNGGLSASSLWEPHYLIFDSSGDLWVSDTSNSRVLEFKPPFSNGMAATLVLGQSSFTTSGNGTTQSSLAYPAGISFDISGNLQVVDTVNNRVMIFEPPFSNGMPATIVLGQPDFTHGLTNQNGSVGANTLYLEPIG